MNEFNTYTNLSNYYDEMNRAEGELRKINEEHLIERSMIFKNTSLLNDCKPTKEFLTMEQRKAGYCSISQLNITKNDPTSGKDYTTEVTDPANIRDEMRNFIKVFLISRMY